MEETKSILSVHLSVGKDSPILTCKPVWRPHKLWHNQHFEPKHNSWCICILGFAQAGISVRFDRYTDNWYWFITIDISADTIDQYLIYWQYCLMIPIYQFFLYKPIPICQTWFCVMNNTTNRGSQRQSAYDNVHKYLWLVTCWLLGTHSVSINLHKVVHVAKCWHHNWKCVM